ncbi:MAG: hypothetical protein JWM23_573 [Microbacteriaceae bacterium]|nr:hypothetical protein [Microbacteriaceae bacterium]
MANTWWVNQGRSAQLGHAYDIVWAPMFAEDGIRISSWGRMDEASSGDMLLHYARGAVRGFSVILGSARPSPRPYTSETWNDDGRILDVDFAPLDTPIWLQSIPQALREGEPKPHAAFNASGGVNQGYFYPVSFNLAAATLQQADIEIEVAPTPLGDRIFVNGSTDRVGVAKVRAEQPHLRARLVAGRAKAPCDMCGIEYPVDYLVTAHIKKRAVCTERERTDPSVVMLACLFGCDAAYELGHLRVDHQGKITIHAPSGAVADKFAHLNGNQPLVFSALNRRYFNAHNATHAAT